MEWLNEAVQSVLLQTYTDFEIILVDDGSTEPLEQYIEINDDRIRLFQPGKIGRSAARNLGIQSGRCNYIAFLDSDDLFHPNKLENQVKAMDAHPGIMLSHTSYTRVDAVGRFLEDVESGSFSGMVYPGAYLNCPIHPSTAMVRAVVFSEGLLFPEQIDFGEDTIVWMEILKKSDIIGIPESLSKIRIHGENCFFNFRQFAEGLNNIADHIYGDKDLTSESRKHLLSSTYANISALYSENGKRLKAKSYSLLSWIVGHLSFYSFLLAVRRILWRRLR